MSQNFRDSVTKEQSLLPDVAARLHCGAAASRARPGAAGRAAWGCCFAAAGAR